MRGNGKLNQAAWAASFSFALALTHAAGVNSMIRVIFGRRQAREQIFQVPIIVQAAVPACRRSANSTQSAVAKKGPCKSHHYVGCLKLWESVFFDIQIRRR